MAKNSLELPEESLASIDHEGNRVYIHPAQPRGFFHKWRNWVQAILMVIFLVLPWLKIGGQQAVLLNIPDRQFVFLGLTFWAHDGPLAFFVLGALTVGLAFFTALLGRVWCGWACPQTVFIEAVFRRIETWIEGNHIQRRKLDATPMNFNKFIKKVSKWSVYVVVSLIITHSFLAYFVGSDRLLGMITSPPAENWVAFLVILITTGLVLFDFGWFREQFCIIACPYGRFQSVLMDDDSLAVIYDEDRGEPRKGKVQQGEQQGDCINCYKCVSVCPTGIDIRRGVQMECIACTACIDACDEVMEKVKKPKGLIRYASEHSIKGQKTHWLRPRIFAYGLLLVFMFAGLTYSIGTRQPIHVSLIRAIESPYKPIPLDNGQEGILNHFRISIKNQRFEPVAIQMKLPETELAQNIQLTTPINPLPIPGGETERSHVFVRFPKELTAKTGQVKTHLILKAKNGSEEFREPMTLIGPKAGPTQ